MYNFANKVKFLLLLLFLMLFDEFERQESAIERVEWGSLEGRSLQFYGATFYYLTCEAT